MSPLRATRGRWVVVSALIFATAACGTQISGRDASPRQQATPVEATPTVEASPTAASTPTGALPTDGPAPGGVRVVDASRLTAQDGWVLTHQRLLVTHDSGESWADVTPPRNDLRAVEGVHFRSPEDGIVATNNYDLEGTLTMYRTSDGGASWDSLVVDPHDFAQPLRVSFSFPTAKLGFAAVKFLSGGAFSSAGLLRTTDGGATWEVVGDAPAASGVTFLDASTGWVVGGPTGIADLFATTDGGRSWNKTHPAGSDVSADYSPPVRVGGLVVLPVTLTGSDRPVTEEFFITPAAVAPRQEWSKVATVELPQGCCESLPAAIPDADTFFATPNGSEQLVRVTGAGRTAEVLPASGLPDGVNKLDFPTPLHGWAVVQNTVCSGPKESSTCISTEALFATEDGGASWHDLTPPAQG